MSWRPRAKLQVIRERARIYNQIRAFFNHRGCLEVDTPVLMPATSTDANIESITVAYAGRSLYLQTSPEFAMKRLLAAGSESFSFDPLQIKNGTASFGRTSSAIERCDKSRRGISNALRWPNEKTRHRQPSIDT